jgi:hypothetical protein
MAGRPTSSMRGSSALPPPCPVAVPASTTAARYHRPRSDRAQQRERRLREQPDRYRALSHDNPPRVTSLLSPAEAT